MALVVTETNTSKQVVKHMSVVGAPRARPAARPFTPLSVRMTQGPRQRGGRQHTGMLPQLRSTPRVIVPTVGPFR